MSRPAVQIGLMAALLGLAAGLGVWWLAIGGGYEWFPMYAAVAAFLTTTFLWWLIVSRRHKSNAWRGAVAGGLSGGISHYVCWYLQIVGANLCYWTTGGCVSSLGEPPIDLLNGLWGALVLSAVSLFFLGWLTVPVGVIGGAVWGWKNSRPKNVAGSY